MSTVLESLSTQQSPAKTHSGSAYSENGGDHAPGRHLKGACVDFEKGLFLISRTFSGIMYPIHCQHLTSAPYDPKKVSSSCELDECVDAARVTRQSGHPAFECVHLQSVQYARPFEKPVDLRDESLEDIVGGRFNWFSIKQKDIFAWQSGNKLVNSGVRLLFDFRVTSMVHILEELYIFLFLKAQFITGRVFAG